MRFIVFVKASKETDAGVLPSAEMLTEMGKFNQQLIDAGVMLDGEGLASSAKGARVDFSGKVRRVTDGPFTEAKELVAGYWVWQCKNLAEAIEWAKRCPNPTGQDGQLEIRQIFELSDFPEVPDAVRKLEENRHHKA